MLFPLLRLFASQNRLHELIFWSIEIEVASVTNVATLFRSDDYASRLISTYSKSIGFKYVQAVLGRPVRELCALTALDVELDPLKEQSAEKRERNARRLMEICQSILDAIMNNQDKVFRIFHVLAVSRSSQ